VRKADIVVVAIGKQRFVRGDWVKPGAVVIDVGIHQVTMLRSFGCDVAQ